MNRRDFIRALGIGSAACALSPLLDLAPISAAPSAALVDVPEFVAYMTCTFRYYVHNPAQCAIFKNISVSDGDYIVVANEAR